MKKSYALIVPPKKLRTDVKNIGISIQKILMIMDMKRIMAMLIA